jgi:DAK2 domain fusion protein YloV
MSEILLLERARAAAAGARTALEASRRRIDDLNVYPVPDGDTGTNLSRTVSAVVAALGEAPPSPPGPLARTVSRAALMGARGNSGIILSQVVRGLCEGLGAASAFDPATVAAALRGGSDAAYRAVREPVEGTMLTVVREMAEAPEAAAAADADVDAVLDRVLAAGADAVERTPRLLAVLQEAGVVDAGGAGLLEIARGCVAGLRGEEVAAVAVGPAPVVEAADAHGYSVHRYCTTYLVEGHGVDCATLEGELAALGDSLVVVGDGDVCKVHVHTDDPGAALSLATAVGVISGVEIADMHAQSDERRTRLSAAPAPDAACDVVCVVAGAGNRALVESLGCRSVVEGGQTMNPSTRELVDAIEACSAAEVVLLPNNPNVILTAEQAAGAAVDRTVLVVPTRSIPAGLAAMVAFDAGRDAVANAQAMQQAAAAVRTGELTTAVRDATADGVAVHQGDYLALVDGRIVASRAAAEAALQALAEQLLDGGAEILTVLRGQGCGDLGERLQAVLDGLADAHPGLDIEVHDGGQPHYPVMLSAE